MSQSSDSEEFYDANEITPTKINTAIKTKNRFHFEIEGNNECLSTKVFSLDSRSQDAAADISNKNTADLTPEKHAVDGRKRFRELRQFMQTEDDEYGSSVNSTPDSQTSSVEGVFGAVSKIAHPFRVIEHDATSMQSLTSLGRLGRIMSGNIDTSGVGASGFSSNNARDPVYEPIDEHQQIEACSVTTTTMMQEPDVIASTKANSLRFYNAPSDQGIMTMSQAGDSTKILESQLPVRPPRRKKRLKNMQSQPDMGQMLSEAIAGIDAGMAPINSKHSHKPPNPRYIVPLPSPASTIESLTRELQNSLDISNLATYHEIDPSTSSQNFSMFTPRCNPPTDDLGTASADKSRSETSSRSSTIKSVYSQKSALSSTKGQSLDLRETERGHCDNDESKLLGPTMPDLEVLKMEFINAGLENRQKSHIGHSSLDASSRTISKSDKHSKGRRKSAGDEELLKQMSMYVKTVLNLDTDGFSLCDGEVPQCINPLSLHIMRLTSEYVSSSSLDEKQRESTDDRKSLCRSRASMSNDKFVVGDNTPVDEGNDETSTGGIRRKTAKLKRFLGSTVKKTMNKAKSFAAEVSHARHKEDVADIVDEVRGEQSIKLKASNSHKGPYEFDGSVRHVQEFSEHTGPVWCMKFSQCGRLLATAGQDKVLRIWVIRDAYSFFQDMRTKYEQKSSPTPSRESIATHTAHPTQDNPSNLSSQDDSTSTPFMSTPFCTYTGHTSDLLDVSWSKNYFVLSSSMDKTVRLWHISRCECLCCFQHIDFVTAIVFHPRDDRYFLSGSLDGKLRLWNIPDKKVELWNEVDGQTKLITAANFCQNGKFAIVGSYDGRCIFYTTDELKYHTQINVRSTRGKNSIGRKISGIEPMPGEDKILVTSNDSRIRLYDLRDLSLSCKYKGYVNMSSQIKASFSHDGKYIVSGSENQCIYIWKTHHDYSKFSSVRRDRNDFWEGIKAHNAVVTCAVFAPNADNIIRMMEERQLASKQVQGEKSSEKAEDNVTESCIKGYGGHVLVSADFNGCIKVFVNKTKPKRSSLSTSVLV